MLLWWRAKRSTGSRAANPGTAAGSPDAGRRAATGRRTGPALLIAAIAFLWLLGTLPIADAMLWTLEGRYQPLSEIPRQPEPAVVVILGGGHAEREGFGPWSSLSDWSRARTVEAVRLSQRTDLPLWFSGYSGAGNTPNAVVARGAALKLGVSRGRTRVFPSPRNTAEEAAVIARALGAAPPARAPQLPNPATRPPTQAQQLPNQAQPPTPPAVILVTSASHMHRAKWLFEQQGLRVIPAPADYQAASRNYSAWSLIPNAAALQRAERAWYEWMGLAWAKLTH